MKLYTLDNQFIEETNIRPQYFTGITGQSGDLFWFKNGRLHKDNGSAFISKNQDQIEWYSMATLIE